MRYEDFFIQEFIPFIEKTYRIHAGKRFREIAGLSMGSFATLSAALFSEQSVIETDEKGWGRIMGAIYGPYKEGI